jgi:hypothetical protein
MFLEADRSFTYSIYVPYLQYMMHAYLSSILHDTCFVMEPLSGI